GVVSFVKPANFHLAEQEKIRFRSEEHTSELQSLTNLVCRLLLEKKTARTDLRFSGNRARRKAQLLHQLRRWARALQRLLLSRVHSLHRVALLDSPLVFLKNQQPPENYPLSLPALFPF